MKRNLLIASLVICCMTLFSSCKKEKNVTPEPTPTPVSEDPFKLSELKYDGKIHLIAGGYSTELSEAFNYRFPYQTTLEDCNAVIVPNVKLNDSKGQIIEAFKNGKSVVVVHPKYETIKRFFNEINQPLFATDQIDSCLFFGFNNRHAMCAMEDYEMFPTIEVELTEEELKDCQEAYKEWLVVGNGDEEGQPEHIIWKKKYPIVYYLDEFVKWLNNQNTPSRGDGESVDIEEVINSWPYTIINQREVTWTVYTYGDTKGGEGDSRDNKVQVTALVETDVTFSIYPVYSFQDQTGHGDYYIVKTNLLTPNHYVYKGRNKEVIYGIHCNYDGPCMTDLNYSCRVEVPDTISETDYLPFFQQGVPVPRTTVGSTTHSTGFSYNIGGSATGGYSEQNGGEGSGTFNFGLSWNDTKTEVVSDILINDCSNGGQGCAAWNYECTNVVKYQSCSNFTEGSSICKNTASFDQSWGWYYGGTTDGCQYSLGKMYVTTNPNYGCAWYIAQGSGRFREMPGPTFTDRVDLVIPNRTPTGQFIIDIPNGTYVTDININNLSMGRTYSFNGQTYTGSFSKWVGAGWSTITLKAGTSSSNMKTYKYKSAGTGSEEAYITRGDEYRVNFAVDFVEVGD